MSKKQPEKKKGKKKGVLLSLGIVLGIVLTAFLCLTEIPLATGQGSQYIPHERYFRELVEENPKLKTVPLTRLGMLGAHDSCSDGINFGSMPNSSEDNIVNNGFLRFAGKGAMVRLSRAQRVNVYEQLLGGVRYLDIRITNIDGVFYTSHGLVSDTLQTNLLRILTFLNESPGEFCVFAINRFYPGKSSWQELHDYIASVKHEGKSLFDYINYGNETEFRELTYNSITDNGSKAGVVLYSTAESDILPFNQFNTSHIFSDCQHTVDLSKLYKGITKNIEKAKKLSDDYLRINQTQMTPNDKEIRGVLMGWSLLAMAENSNDFIVTCPEIDDMIKAMPIYLCDDSVQDISKFQTAIIDKLRTYNLSLEKPAEAA